MIFCWPVGMTPCNQCPSSHNRKSLPCQVSSPVELCKKTLLDFVKITWSFAMIFREPFATWVLAFASSNHSKVAFASFRGEYRENKRITIHHHVSVKESLAHSILITWSQFRHELSSTFGDLYSSFREFSWRILWKQMSFVLAHLHEPVPAPKHSYIYIYTSYNST